MAKKDAGNSRFADVGKAYQFSDRYLQDFCESIIGQTFSTKKARQMARLFRRFSGRHRRKILALACFKPSVDLINNKYATPTSHNTTVLVTLLKRLERINNFHCTIPTSFGKISSCGPYAFVHSLSTTGAAKFGRYSTTKKLAAYFHTRPSSGRYGKLKGAYLRQLVRRMWSVNRMITIAWHGEYPSFRFFQNIKATCMPVWRGKASLCPNIV